MKDASAEQYKQMFREHKNDKCIWMDEYIKFWLHERVQSINQSVNK